MRRMRLEGIKRVVDGLLHMQPFPNRTLECIQGPRTARFPILPMRIPVPVPSRIIPCPLPQILILIGQPLPQDFGGTVQAIFPREHLWGDTVFIGTVCVSTVEE